MPKDLNIVKCLHHDCPAMLMLRRGLCRRHYEALSKSVQRGKLTWEQAIEQGLCTEGSKPTLVCKKSRTTWPSSYKR